MDMTTTTPNAQRCLDDDGSSADAATSLSPPAVANMGDTRHLGSSVAVCIVVHCLHHCPLSALHQVVVSPCRLHHDASSLSASLPVAWVAASSCASLSVVCVIVCRLRCVGVFTSPCHLGRGFNVCVCVAVILTTNLATVLATNLATNLTTNLATNLTTATVLATLLPQTMPPPLSLPLPPPPTLPQTAPPSLPPSLQPTLPPAFPPISLPMPQQLDVSHLERYCTNVLLARLTKVRC
jgi:hypothetical protein